jgi:hypothetical protein
MSEPKGASNRYRSSNPQQIPDSGKKLLRRAHQMLEVGKHTDAANIFENLARKAEDQGLLWHSPFIYLQAGRANLLSGNLDSGINVILHGLSILRREQRWSELARSGNRVVDDLQNFGFSTFSEEVTEFLSATLPNNLNDQPDTAQTNLQLPLRCPDCYGVLWPAEVIQTDVETIECQYCGTVINNY